MTVEIFHDQSPRKNVVGPSGDRTCDLLIPVGSSAELAQRLVKVNNQSADDEFCMKYQSLFSAYIPYLTL